MSAMQVIMVATLGRSMSLVYEMDNRAKSNSFYLWEQGMQTGIRGSSDKDFTPQSPTVKKT